jgi:hypothetical protein
LRTTIQLVNTYKLIHSGSVSEPPLGVYRTKHVYCAG